MEIRQAILKAADWIEKHPEQFSFGSIQVGGCGSPGCALGWISHFGGAIHGKHYYNWAARDFMKLAPETQAACGALLPEIRAAEFTFYNRMHVLKRDWQWSAPDCAKGMRLYADKYHPAPITLPDWNAIATAEKVSA